MSYPYTCGECGSKNILLDQPAIVPYLQVMGSDGVYYGQRQELYETGSYESAHCQDCGDEAYSEEEVENGFGS